MFFVLILEKDLLNFSYLFFVILVLDFCWCSFNLIFIYNFIWALFQVKKIIFSPNFS